jgi:hypothetical protein
MEAGETTSGRRSKVITKIAAEPGRTSNVVAVEIHASTAELAEKLLKHIENERFRRRLSTLLRKQLRPPSSGRERPGEIQPEIPATLRDALRALTASSGPRMANEKVRRELEEWVDFGTGKRKSNDRRKLLLPSRRRDFREHGRALVQKKENLVRFTFNAGTAEARSAVLRLAKALQMNASEFFSALIERIVRGGAAETGHSDPSSNAPSEGT